MKIHYLNLHNEPFLLIKEGTKRIEMRLFDEKRKLIQIGDFIVFKNNRCEETITAEVIELRTFPSFKELYNAFDPEVLGYKTKDNASYLDMNKYYSDALINKYGVLAIKIKLR
ncbi:MAG: ASCH domain-containing protein [Bacilli bacterium]|nr:ASCH domain-containing protein [Bacilli bacterium]